MGLFSAVRNAGYALEVFSTGLQVAGNNISNANTPNYIRENLNVVTNSSYSENGVTIGTGARILGVKQQIDKFLETRIYAASSENSASATRSNTYKQLETILSSLSSNDLSSGLNQFLAKVNDVANQPSSSATRQLLIQQGQTLAGSISGLRTSVDSLRQAANGQVSDLVNEANQLIDQISKLNPQIVQMELAGQSGSDASGLRNTRYAALTRLAEIVPVKVVEQPTGQVDVFLNNDYLVLAGQTQHLETETASDRGVPVTNVHIENSHVDISGSGGELNGVITGRDQILGGYVDQLDAYAKNIIGTFNQIHSSGEGLAGFTDVTGSYSVNNPLQPLNAAGLTFPPQHGSFDIKVVNQQTGEVTTQTINIDLDNVDTANNTSLTDLKNALNAVGNVSASITNDGKLRITAANGYEIKFGNDSSHVLAGLGINTFFTGTDSTTIGVNQTISTNPDLLATGQGGGPGDNSNALALANFTSQKVSGLNNLSIDDFYQNVLSDLAQKAASEDAISQGAATFKDSLNSQRSQYSGVSLDEEAIQIMQLQRSYQSTAKFISTVDQLYNILLDI
ncbi:MAG: flagellar hook-associated protein FlgK [Planctomycetales bacterium]